MEALRPGDMINDRYEVCEVLGQGHSGTVYAGIDTQHPTKRRVAIKKMNMALLATPAPGGNNAAAASSQNLKDWEQEVQLLKQMNHPNVVSYVDDIRSSHEFYVITELVDRGSLLSAIKSEPEKKMDEVTAAKCIAQVVNGVLYLHKKDVIHRDLKAANVLIATDGRVKLTDFGLAAVGPTAASDKDLVGSVYWMAPEMIQKTENSASFVEASDIWSIGCLTVELLTGRPPFHDRKPENALFHIVEKGVVEPPAGVSDECQSFIRACCERDVTRRANAAQLLDHPWLAAIASELFNSRSTPSSLNTSTSNLQQSYSSASMLGNTTNQQHTAQTASDDVTTHKVPQPADDPEQRSGSVESNNINTTTVIAPEGSGSLANTQNSAAAFEEAEQGSGPLQASIDEPGTPTTEPPKTKQPDEECAEDKSSVVEAHKAASAAETVAVATPLPPPQTTAPPTSLDAAGGYVAWVENNLLSNNQEQWLHEGGLSRTINVLKTIKAQEAFQILHCIAHTAKQSVGIRSSFFLALGACGFWNLDDVTTFGTKENILTLFEACCRAQAPHVKQYAPADKHALTCVLHLPGMRYPVLKALAVLLIGQRNITFNPATAATGAHASSVISSAATTAATTGQLPELDSTARPSSQDATGAANLVGQSATSANDPAVGGGYPSSGASGGGAGTTTSAGVVSSTSAFIPAPEYEVDEHWRHQARERFINDGAMHLLHKELVERILNGFSGAASGVDVHNGLDWCTVAFDILYQVAAPLPHSIMPTPGGASANQPTPASYADLDERGKKIDRDLWLSDKHVLTCLTEGCRLRMTSAVHILSRITQQDPVYVGNTIKAAHFLQTSMDTNFDATIRNEVIRLFPLLQKSEAARNNINELDSSVPLLAHILSISTSIRKPPTEQTAGGGGGGGGGAPFVVGAVSGGSTAANQATEDPVLGTFVILCRDGSTAAAFSQYPKMLTTVIQKMAKARIDRNKTDLLRCIQITTLLFEQCERPDMFVTNTDLCRLLSVTVQEAGAMGPNVDRAASALLDALGAQSNVL